MKKFNILKEYDYFYCFILLIFTVITYFGLSIHPIIHDFYNEYFPQRFFQINCIRNHILPFWNPYQSMGTPAHADPQTSTFYLPVYIFALFGEYTSFCCSIELVFHIFVAACGFFFLGRNFTLNKPIACVAAVCYSVSGFFVGNAQHLAWIIAAAWLPWVIHYTINLLEHPDLLTSVKLAISCSFLISGGYPGFIFTFCYLLLFLLVVEIISLIREKKFLQLRKIVLFGLLTVALFVLLSIPVLISFIDAQNIATRGQSLDYSVTSHAFPSLFTLFIPFSVTIDYSIYPSDISMRNIYIGLLTLVFVVFGLIKNSDKTVWTILAFGILSLLISYGKYLPIHKLTFDYLPFFNVIRIPTLMRIYFIISLLLLSVVGMNALLSDTTSNKKDVTKICIILTFLAFFAIISALILPKIFNFETKLPNSFFAKLKIDFVYIITIIIFAFAIIRFSNKSSVLFKLFSILIIIDVISHVYIFGPFTIYNKELTHSDLSETTIDRGWPIPEKLTTTLEINQHNNSYLLWKNAGCFYKQPEWMSYNPFILNNYNELRNFYKENDQDLNIEVAFSPKTIIYDEALHNFLNTDTAYTKNIDLSKFKPDTNTKVQIITFRPDIIEIETICKDSSAMVLAQSFCKGWKCKSDKSNDLEISTVNASMMMVKIPNGKHILEFSYYRPDLKITFILQNVMFVICIFAGLFAKSCICKLNFSKQQNK